MCVVCVCRRIHVAKPLAEMFSEENGLLSFNTFPSGWKAQIIASRTSGNEESIFLCFAYTYFFWRCSSTIRRKLLVRNVRMLCVWVCSCSVHCTFVLCANVQDANFVRDSIRALLVLLHGKFEQLFPSPRILSIDTGLIRPPSNWLLNFMRIQSSR